MFSDRFVQRLGRAAAAAALVLSLPAGATVITAIDEFTITRSGITGSPLGSYLGQPVFYRDAFADGIPPPSGSTFFNGGAGTYNVNGTYPAGSEAGGKLTLDSSLGGAFVNASGVGRTQQLALLLTDINPASQAGLKQTFHTFAVFGLFDLAVPPARADGYGIFVNDGGPSGATESIDLFVRRELNDNIVIRFQEQDFLNSVLNTLELVSLVIPAGADQIELQLQRADLANNLLTASYRFWDDGAALSPGFTTLSATANFFTNNGWARGGFFAVQAIPEPGTLALLLLAAASLFALARPRSRSAAPRT